MGDNTSSLFEVAEKIFDIYEAALGTFTPVVSVNNLFWGDQLKIPDVPAICIEPMEQRIEWAGVGPMVRVEIIHEVHIILYTAKLVDSQTGRREADAFAEHAKNVLHTPGNGLTNTHNANGVVLAGNIVRMNFGYARRNTLRASRLVWQGKSKTPIVPVP